MKFLFFEKKDLQSFFKVIMWAHCISFAPLHHDMILFSLILEFVIVTQFCTCYDLISPHYFWEL